MDPAEQPKEEFSGVLSDASRWAHIEIRPGDIVVNTPPKSGTTWVQSILAMLIAGDVGVDADTSMKSPWIDIKFRPIEEVNARLGAQDHRRQMKSHTPFKALPWWDGVRYVCVYRHPIDVHFSFRKHVQNMAFDGLDAFYPDDPRESFRLFLEGCDPDATPLDTLVAHYRCSLARQGRENLLLLHYRDMLADLSGAVAGIAAHIGYDGPSTFLDDVTEAASFSSMRSHAARFAPGAGTGFWHDDTGFFDSASCNKWQGVLSDADLTDYDARIGALLSAEDRVWLEWGSAGA